MDLFYLDQQAQPVGNNGPKGESHFKGPSIIGGSLFISNSVPSRRTAYDTIINTGGLGLIRDAKLVQEIQGYYAAVESIRSFENLMQETRTRFTEAQRSKGLSPVDGHTMDELTKHFSGSSDMTTAAKEYWLFTNFHLRLLARHREAADRIATILEKAAP